MRSGRQVLQRDTKTVGDVGYTGYLDCDDGFTVSVTVFIKVISLHNLNMYGLSYVNYTLTKLFTRYGGEWWKNKNFSEEKK